MHCFLVQVENRKNETLERILKTYLHHESVIYSDCWKAYTRLIEIFSEHHKVNHSVCFFDPITDINTNPIEGNWAGVKNQVENAQR